MSDKASDNASDRANDKWVADDIDTNKPAPARIYDYLIGGFHNFEVDRATAQMFMKMFPNAPLDARVNRAFLRRAVKFLVEQGIDQFIDLGSGIPATGNVHEVAQRQRPGARVVYVDVDPIAVSHGRLLLADNPDAAMIAADMRDAEAVLAAPEVARLIDLSRPVGLLLVSVLHFIPDGAVARRIIEGMRARLAPGSYVAFSHTASDGVDPELVKRGEAMYSAAAAPFKSRSSDEIRGLFDGFELVPPGLVHTPLWLPEGPDDLLYDQPTRSATMAAVGRKP